MHELSIASAVLNTAVGHADGRQVKVVGLRVGALRQVVPDSLCFYFEIVSRDTVCEGARVELIESEARLRCNDCAHEWTPEWALFRCLKCDSGDVQVTSGEELQVEYIEVDEKEPACIGPR